MRNRQKRMNVVRQELAQAETYKQWLTAAEALDEAEGLLAWREKEDSELLHVALIREHIDQMQQCLDWGDTHGLTRVLQESLYRHLGELSNPELYAVARTGTKYVATEFLDMVEQAMGFICGHELPGVSESHKLSLYRDAERVYGQPALMLSGGASFGIYHLGVTRALWQQGLLPDVVAGSSMGAIVAGGICTRNEAELEALFMAPEDIQLKAFRWLNPGRIWEKRHAMDPGALKQLIDANIGKLSFREAAEHSGRTLNISVSPTRTRQKPRLLNSLTAPDVLIDSAVMASCAVPGLYPPVTLKARYYSGHGKTAEKSYMPTERWIDGTVHGDLPLMRMARLHNVNRTIVSQANPHVLPFISHYPRQNARATLKDAGLSLLQAYATTTLELSRSAWSSSSFAPLLDQVHAMTTQNYLGDINIQFPFQPLLYRKILSNPSEQDLKMFIKMGERATWPQLAMIRDQTRVSRAFVRCIDRLKVKAAAERQDVD
ncbi:MAG: DUF3336 domain-containing protein [Halomonadaceae bacterium]|nr:MAG: DUF3336 domain-containing protein [Halomonadaceae bacterium]